MIGNVIQSQVPRDASTTRRRAALSFVLMACILIDRVRATRALLGSRELRGGAWHEVARATAARPALGRWAVARAASTCSSRSSWSSLFSFNDNKGRFNFTWQGFTLDHWLHPFAVEGLGDGRAQLAGDRGDLDADRARARDVHGAGARALRLPRARRRRTCSCSCRWPRPEVVLGAALLGLFLTVNVATRLRRRS